MTQKQKGIIKFYEYQVGNNCLVGRKSENCYDRTEVPKWYRVQADIFKDNRQLADEETNADAGTDTE